MDVRGPDGKIVRFPDGTDPAKINEVMSSIYAKSAPQKPTSFLQGVKEGLQTPILNAASAIEAGLDKIGIKQPVVNAAMGFENAMNSLFGLSPQHQSPTVDQARQYVAQRNAMAPTRGSGLGELTGNVIGTLPVGMIPGGPMAQGALGGALLTDKRDPASIAKSAAAGALGAKVGDVLLNKAAKAFAPKVNKALNALMSRGVEVTPGQAGRASNSTLGRMASSIEDRMTSLPGPTGTAVQQAREKASADFVKGAINDSLGEIGQKLPADIEAGHAAVKFAQKAASNAYDDALGGMRLVADDQLVNDLTTLATDVNNGGLTDDFASKFAKTVNNVVSRRSKGDVVDGDTLKTILSELRKTERSYSGTRGSEGEFGDAIGKLADIIEEGAIRSSPSEASAKLFQADRAYAKLVRIEGAAKSASDGVFSPAQLETAIRQADTSVRKRAVAAGEGLMQDYAAAGRKILPSKIGSSGTAERQGIWNPIAWGVDLAAYGPYKVAQGLTPPVANFMANRPGNALFQRYLEQSAPYAGILAAPAAVEATK